MSYVSSVYTIILDTAEFTFTVSGYNFTIIERFYWSKCNCFLCAFWCGLRDPTLVWPTANFPWTINWKVCACSLWCTMTSGAGCVCHNKNSVYSRMSLIHLCKGKHSTVIHGHPC